jgi:hypothetical protein
MHRYLFHLYFGACQSKRYSFALQFCIIIFSLLVLTVINYSVPHTVPLPAYVAQIVGDVP